MRKREREGKGKLGWVFSISDVVLVVRKKGAMPMRAGMNYERIGSEHVTDIFKCSERAGMQR